MNTESLDAHEGYEATPYLDTESLWTVGKGHCLERKPFSAFEWKYLLDNKLITVSLSQEGANYLRDEALRDIIQRLTMQLPNWASIDEMRQDVLIEMCYQMGPGFLDSHSAHCWPGMTKAVKAGDWKTAAAEALDSKWAKTQTPQRALELARVLETGSHEQLVGRPRD